jgi:hypothetical protein
MHNDGYHVHDPGGEFVGIEFQTLLQDCHIRDVCSNAENPQSSAICKRISVVYHPNTGHLAGIGKLPALAGWYIRLVLLSTFFA